MKNFKKRFEDWWDRMWWDYPGTMGMVIFFIPTCGLICLMHILFT